MANDVALFDRALRNTPARYLLSLALTAVALLLRWLLNPFRATYAPFVTLYPAVVFAAWYCGIGPSLLTPASAIVRANSWLVVDPHALGSINRAQLTFT